MDGRSQAVATMPTYAVCTPPEPTAVVVSRVGLVRPGMLGRTRELGWAAIVGRYVDDSICRT